MTTIDYSLIVLIYAIALVVGLAVYVWVALALSAVFRKAGANPNHAWIPIVNMFTLAKISGRPESPWLLFIPFYGIYIQYLITVGVSNRFGRSNGFGLFGVIFMPIWASILGWGSARWVGERQASGTMGAEWGTPHAAAGEWPTPQSGAFGALNNVHSDGAGGYGAAPAMPGAGYEAAPAPAMPGVAAPAGAMHQQEMSWLDQSRARPAAAGMVPPAPAAAPAQDDWHPFAPLGASDTPEPASADSWASASESQQNPVAASAFAPPPAPPAPAAPAGVPAAPASAPETVQLPVPPAPPALPPVPPTMPAGFGSPGSTRMREDSEVVAQARAAQAMTPPPLPPLPESFDVPAAPIVVPGASATIPAPPVPLSGSVPLVEGAAFEDSEWMQNSLSTGIANVATPVSAADSISTQEVDAAEELWAPRLRQGGDEPSYEEPSYEQPMDHSVSAASAVSAIESSVEVSAVAALPDAGSPRAARTSVSAYHADAGVPSEEGIDDQTIVASRRRFTWNLNLPVGTSVALTSDYVILGRRPDEEPEFPLAQLISVADGTRTISKTHAMLALVDGAWTITDLGSTNGVVLIDDSGAEHELEPHQPAVLTSRFLLGDAELTIEAAGE